MVTVAEKVRESITTPEPADDKVYRAMVFRLARKEDVPTDEVRQVMEAALRSPEDLERHISLAVDRIEAFSQKADGRSAEISVELKECDRVLAEVRRELFELRREFEQKEPSLVGRLQATDAYSRRLLDESSKLHDAFLNTAVKTSPEAIMARGGVNTAEQEEQWRRTCEELEFLDFS